MQPRNDLDLMVQALIIIQGYFPNDNRAGPISIDHTANEDAISMDVFELYHIRTRNPIGASGDQLWDMYVRECVGDDAPKNYELALKDVYIEDVLDTLVTHLQEAQRTQIANELDNKLKFQEVLHGTS